MYRDLDRIANQYRKTSKAIFRNPFLVFIPFIFIVNITFRLIYILYGYIATEEGILIYNQKLAYSGLLPFKDYNAWNSILNDYFVGWYQFILPHTIFNQRLIGMFIAIGVFFITLEITKNFRMKLFTLICALLLTFGSFTYLFYSNIPYSEQTMTLFMMLSLCFLSKNITSRKAKLSCSILGMILMTIAGIVRIRLK